MPNAKLSPVTPLRHRQCTIVVGASSGIGAALVSKLAHEGFTVAALARRGDLLEQVCAQANAVAGETRALPYIHDVTDFDSVPGLLQKVVEDLGGLDLFIYNAGIQNHVQLDEFDFAKDRQMLEANTLGALAWLNPIASMFYHMKAGHIVGISSVAGDRGRVGAPAYNTSKAALTTYLEALRNRLTRRGVAVTTVKPGFVDTDILRSAGPRKTTFAVITPEQAAEGIWKAIKARKQTVYIPGLWGLIMLIIRHVPSFVFRRLSF